MRTTIYLFSILFLLGSCIKNNPDPSWIEVGTWKLVENPNSQNSPGILTDNISDAWVYVNDELVGVFEVPFKIPILKDGDAEVKVYPAIRNNGISATKKIYPFLDAYVTNVNLVKNETVVITPITQYKNATQFWIEDFEDATYDILEGTASLATIVRVNDPAVLNPEINDGFFGRISLDETINSYSGSTTANFNGSLVMNLPRGQEVYLEIDYHTTNAITTGVIAVGSGGVVDNPYIQLNPQSESEVHWKKIYIDLREIVSSSSTADYFEFSFRAILDEGDSSGEINIDNIKAVYF